MARAGSFAAPELHPAEATLGPVKLADLDSDGTLDLVGMSQEWADDAYTVQVAMGLGGGVFAPIKTRKIVDHPRGLALVDLDGDEFLDVVATNRSHMSLLRGLGDGELTVHVTYILGSESASGVTAGDVDGDGHQDIVVALGLKRVGVWFGRGDGTLELDPLKFATDPAPITEGVLHDVLLADVDGDARVDILASNITAVVSVLLAVP